MAEAAQAAKPAAVPAADARQQMPTDKELEGEIKEVLRDTDLTKTSLKEVRNELERRFRLSPGTLDGAKEKLKELVSAEIARIQEAQEDADEDAEGDEEGVAEADVQAEETARQSKKEKRSSKAEKEKRSSNKRSRDVEGEGGSPAAKKGPGDTKMRQASAMNREDFLKQAKGFKVEIGDKKIQVAPRQFSTGSCGFFANCKAEIQVAGQALSVQCQVNCTVIGSKQWKDS